MINEMTVFVLGAGASSPYGLPTGAQLSRYIIDSIKYLQNSSEERDLLKSAFPEINFDQLYDLGRRFSCAGGISIDRWLELNQKFKDIGKLLIAKEINKREGAIMSPDSDWCEYLWTHHLSSGQAIDIRRLKDNQVSFITFNYDRSLEHRLFGLALNTYSDSSIEDCKAAVSSFAIYHVHGQVGALPWMPSDNMFQRNYEVSHEWGDAVKSAGSINIISDADVDSDTYKAARKKLVLAKKIYFLGFGYNEENLARLRCPNGKYNAFEVMGSGFMVGAADLKRLTFNDNPFRQMIEVFGGMNALEFLKSNVSRY